MTITEETRHTIYEAFRSSFGDEVANGLMELLPPVGWADVATGWADVATKHDLIALKQDLIGLEERMDTRFHALEERIDLRFEASEARLGERLERSLRRQSTAFTASLLSSLALFGVIDRLVA